ncbi:MAG: VWA domain-containing protein [Planctomycetota bacterium]
MKIVSALFVSALFVSAQSVLPLLCLGSLLPGQVSPRSDFVFLIDGSASMGAEIRNIRDALPAFVVDLQQHNVDHRFAVVEFGDQPVLRQDLTDNVTLIQAALDGIVTTNRVREAGLEVIRMALGETPAPLPGGPISFRPATLKNLILVTDEDSDQPVFVADRLPGQTSTQPPNPWSTTNDWQREVDNTAAAVLRYDCHLNMMVRSLNGRTLWQYGTPTVTALFADGRYDREGTLQNLQTRGLTQNLQAQLLQAGALCRVFDVVAMRQNSTFVRDFFVTKLQETLCPCLRDATWTNYGIGWSGSSGVPTIGLGSAPSICAGIDLQVGNSWGQTQPCCVLFSDQPTNRLLSFGGRLLVDTATAGFWETGVGVSPAGLSLPLQVPCNSLSFCGMTFYAQGALLDPGAAGGVALTSGLQFSIGN